MPVSIVWMNRMVRHGGGGWSYARIRQCRSAASLSTSDGSLFDSPGIWKHQTPSNPSECPCCVIQVAKPMVDGTGGAILATWLAAFAMDCTGPLVYVQIYLSSIHM